MDFKERLVQHYGFSQADWEATLDSFEEQHFAAGELFLETGKTSRRLAYLRAGLMRSYFFDEKGREISTQFFREGQVVISIKSFNDQLPSRENIVAVEDCIADVISFERMKELSALVPAWKSIARDVDKSKYTRAMNRSIQLQSQSALERYKEFMKKHPDLLQRVPLIHIASYLGIDNATLSRIRKKI